VARLLAAGGLTVGIAVLSAGRRPSGGCALTRQEPTGTWLRVRTAVRPRCLRPTR